MSEIKISTKYNTDKICALWADIFGNDEAEMERIQIDGTEDGYNTDIVYSALEDERIIGTVHITVPKINPTIAGVSGVCSLPEARGKGVAKLLMSAAMNTLTQMGVDTVFLGTENPIASKLYSGFGFSYLAGSRVMVNNLSGKCPFYEVYQGIKNNIRIVRGTPDFRIPLIGLINLNERLVVADINAGIMGRSFFSQNSCMGLYPKYENVRKKGGDYFGAIDENGTLGAVATVLPADFGTRMDICIAESFSPCLSELVEYCEKQYGQVYFQIATEDNFKIELIKKAGFSMHKTTQYPITDFCTISTGVWTR